MFAAIRSAGIGLSLIVVLLALSALSLIAGAGAQEPGATPVFASTMSADEAVAAATDDNGLLRFDVAENATQFVFDPDFVHDDGMPANGSAFVTRGYLYPAGTLTDSNGVNPDGSPEFPDQVLGEWVCRGWFIGDGAHTTSGPWNATTQFYNFGGEYGPVMLVSDGYEIADIGVAVARPVTGGTGPFLGAGGEVRQTLLGINAVMGVNIQIEIEYNV